MTGCTQQRSQQRNLQLELEEVRRRTREELASVHDKLDAEIASKNDTISMIITLTYKFMLTSSRRTQATPDRVPRTPDNVGRCHCNAIRCVMLPIPAPPRLIQM